MLFCRYRQCEMSCRCKYLDGNVLQLQLMSISRWTLTYQPIQSNSWPIRLANPFLVVTTVDVTRCSYQPFAGYSVKCWGSIIYMATGAIRRCSSLSQVNRMRDETAQNKMKEINKEAQRMKRVPVETCCKPAAVLHLPHFSPSPSLSLSLALSLLADGCVFVYSLAVCSV